MAKETREILRDPITLGVALAMPLVMLLLFGYAVSLDVRAVPMGVLDHDRSPMSRALADRFVATEYFSRAAAFDDLREVEAALRGGRIKLALIIPPEFAHALARAEPVRVQALVDGTYASTARLVAGYAAAIVAAGQGAPPPVRLETRVWYNPELRSANFVIPGLFGVILMAFPPLLTALAIVREKETGSIQQVFASPLTGAEYLTGKLIPYGLIAFLQLLTVMAVGFVWFATPLRGSLAFLIGAGLLYVFCTVGIGLLVSTVTRSQLAAMLLALVVTLMPSFLFSGFLFPIFAMPYSTQLYTAIFPARYFIEFSRAVVLKGAGFAELWPNLVLLLAYTLAVFALAAWRFRKKVA